MQPLYSFIYCLDDETKIIRNSVIFVSMNTNQYIHSSAALDFKAYLQFMSMSDRVELAFQRPTEEGHEWYFYRPLSSTTAFIITFQKPDRYIISMDCLASVDDYKFFPYLVDSLAQHLKGKIEELDETETIYQRLNEEWMEETIADEIARIKGTLTIFPKYYICQSLVGAAYVSTQALGRFGVTLTSATPRIYGYIQHLMLHDLIPIATQEEIAYENSHPMVDAEEDYDVDIPQHQSIGRVKSWQLNGEETFESYSKEDVDLLLNLAVKYLNGAKIDGVVLNDIGTIYQEGIGTTQDGEIAAKWFQRAYNEGDTLYAPTNLGDLYRKGGVNVEKSLPKAFAYYQKSTDPYSFYRIGQAYEEGWIDIPNQDMATVWYHKAAEAGHHLALKKLGR